MLRRAGDFKTDFGPGEGAGANRGMPVAVLSSPVLRVMGGGSDVGGGDSCLSSRLRYDVEEREEGVESASGEPLVCERGCGDCVIRSTVSFREGRSWVSRSGMPVN